jgi:catechol 2,3-dioxygenase-like lactoylglutathione lyase family enzyme
MSSVDGQIATVLGPPVQLAYAVTDVDTAASNWASVHGAGPFFVSRHIAVGDVRYRGQPGTFDHSSAYGQWGSVMVELVQDHTVGPSPIADVVVPGRSGLHHLAFFVDALDAASAALVTHGWPEALFARTASGQCFAFHDATADLGHMVEIYEGSPRLRDFYSMVADASIGWDGSRPIRELNPTKGSST